MNLAINHTTTQYAMRTLRLRAIPLLHQSNNVSIRCACTISNAVDQENTVK